MQVGLPEGVRLPRQVLTIVVPLYNESNRIDSTIQRWSNTDLLARFHWILVDDGSTDDTFERIDVLQQHYPTVQAIKLGHRGKTRAIQAALECVSTQGVLCLDADTWYAGDAQTLERECTQALSSNVDVMAFRLEPLVQSTSLITKMQAAEYAFFPMCQDVCLILQAM